MLLAKKLFMDGKTSLSEIIRKVEEVIKEKGLDGVTHPELPL